MLNPNTGIEIGNEVNEVRKENAALRARLALMEKVVEAAKKVANPKMILWDAMEELTAALRELEGL